MKKKSSAIYRLGKMILLTSSILLDSFFSDDADKRSAQENLQAIRNTLQQAALQKNLVVLQLETEKADKFEVVSGWIVGKNIGKDQVVVKIQNDHQQMRIISLPTIKKISTLPTSQRKM